MEEDIMKYCVSCKKMMSDSFKFCPYCSSALEDYNEYIDRIKKEAEELAKREKEETEKAKIANRRRELERVLDNYLAHNLAVKFYNCRPLEEVEEMYDIAIGHVTHNASTVVKLFDNALEEINQKNKELHGIIQKVIDSPKEKDIAKIFVRIVKEAIDKMFQALLKGGYCYSLDFPEEYRRYTDTTFEIHHYLIENSFENVKKEIANSKNDFGLIYFENLVIINHFKDIITREIRIIKEGLVTYNSSYYYDIIYEISQKYVEQLNGRYCGYDRKKL